MSVSRAGIKTISSTEGHYLRGNNGYWFMVILLLLHPSVNAFADSPILLHDVTYQTGITFVHTDGSSGRHYIMETVSAGLALFDTTAMGT